MIMNAYARGGKVDFLEPGGFGESLGNDVSVLRKAIEPCRKVLWAFRDAADALHDAANSGSSATGNSGRRGGGPLVVHTREGHRPDLSDCHPNKLVRYGTSTSGLPPVIGSRRGGGEKGRVLVRGEPGHDIVSELKPLPNEPVVDKPGKGSFYGTDLEVMLRARNVTTLIVCGVTTEICVSTTVREANDRGFHCVVVRDACASYHPDFHDAEIKMIKSQGGILGSVTTSSELVKSLEPLVAASSAANGSRSRAPSLAPGAVFDSVSSLLAMWLPVNLKASRAVRVTRNSTSYYQSVCFSAPKTGWKGQPGVCQAHVTAKKKKKKAGDGGKGEVVEIISVEAVHTCKAEDATRKRQYQLAHLEAASQPLASFVPNSHKRGVETREMTEATRRELGIELKGTQARNLAKRKRMSADGGGGGGGREG